MYTKINNHIKNTLLASQSPESLAILRIVLSSLILVFSVPPIQWILNLATVNETFIKPNLIIEVFQFLLGDGILLSLSFIKVIYFLILISGLFTVIGLFSKYSIPLIAFLYTFIIAYMWSFGEVHHPRSVLCWFFIIMALSKRSADAYSLDAYFGLQKPQNYLWKYSWPSAILMIALSSAYCFSGLWKIFYQGGVEWLNGYTLQYYIVSKGENFLTKFIIGKSWLLITLSYFSIILEILFPLAVFFKKYSKWFLIAAFFFHLGNYFMRGENGIFIIWPLIAIGYSFSLDKLLKNKFIYEFNKKK